jgi:hypothetical protein
MVWTRRGRGAPDIANPVRDRCLAFGDLGVWDFRGAGEGLPRMAAPVGWARMKSSPTENLAVLKDRRVLITGASRGVGFESARLFLQSGARVIGAARDAERLTGGLPSKCNFGFPMEGGAPAEPISPPR